MRKILALDKCRKAFLLGVGAAVVVFLVLALTNSGVYIAKPWFLQRSPQARSQNYYPPVQWYSSGNGQLPGFDYGDVGDGGRGGIRQIPPEPNNLDGCLKNCDIQFGGTGAEIDNCQGECHDKYGGGGGGGGGSCPAGCVAVGGGSGGGGGQLPCCPPGPWKPGTVPGVTCEEGTNRCPAYE